MLRSDPPVLCSVRASFLSSRPFRSCFGCNHSCQEVGHGLLCKGLFLTLSFCVGRGEAEAAQGAVAFGPPVWAHGTQASQPGQGRAWSLGGGRDREDRHVLL